MAANYIVMDLEFNRSNRRFTSVNNGIRLRNEIVQIGAIKLDSERRIVDMYSSYIRPTAYSKMNTEVAKLTGITTEMIWSGNDFKTEIVDFLKWCGNDTSFITWSGNDIVVLEDNMLYHGMGIENLPKCYDIQMMFDDQISENDRDMSLAYALWKLGIDPEDAHDALNDARNTVEVFRKLDLKDGLKEYLVA